ncbi:MAG TPA: phage portal protein [Mizugakiibacter sp.]
MNGLDRAILAISPGWAARRARARHVAQVLASAYEAAKPGRLRKRARDYGSGNAAVATSAKALRDIARNLDRNHDLARGILNVLVRNVVGPTGIGVEPQPKNPDGTVNETLAAQLSAIYKTWTELPEVTGEFNWARAEQLLCRSWLRDGECLWQYLEGEVPFLTHGTDVPFSLELLEADLLPLDYDQPASNIMQGIECNAWGRPVGFWIYKNHPGEPNIGWVPQIKRVSTDLIGHLKLVDRIGQRRGVSMFASVLSRLDDLKDYEESERIAAKVAASMAAVIIKGDAGAYEPPLPDASGNIPKDRALEFSPGMIFDDLRPGESVGTIDSKRPNPNAQTWRDGQLRAVAAGVDASNSSVSRNYNGTYSAQRQELVETDLAYKTLSHAFIDQCTREVYKRMVAACVLGGLIRVPRGMSFAQLSDALYIPPQMPWIDPQREANAFDTLEGRCYMSGPEIIRRRGANPREVIAAEKQWQQQLRDAGIVITTNTSTTTSGAAPGEPGAAADDTSSTSTMQDTTHA